jgi:peptidoglycan hydrolase CwlO-like protein
MKKMVLVGIVVLSLAACDNSGNTAAKADSLKDKLDTTLDKIGDSAKAKGGRALEAIKDKVQDLGNKADSVRKDTTR